MAEKNLNSRIVHKHDIEVNWSKATNFIPKIGEIIVYDPDENHAAARVKIGDGVKTVVELAFIDDAAKAALFKEIDMVDEKVEALGQLVGDASIPEQIQAAMDELHVVAKTGSWNDLEDRTHGEFQQVITYDGNKDLPSIHDTYYLVSEDVPSINDIIGKQLTLLSESYHETRIILETNIIDKISTKGWYVIRTFVYDEILVVVDETLASNDFGLTVQKGIYFINIEDGREYVSELILGYDIKQLDEKFIPTATEDQLIQLLMDINAFPAMTDKNGSVFTHNDSILLI